MGFFAHATACIDDGATIGDGTKVWHFCHVSSDARIGCDCVLGQNVFVACGVQVGNQVKIQNNVSLYEGVILEDNVFCGPSAVFTNVINPRSEIVRKGQYKPTVVRRGATLGANATVICGHTIGEYAFVAAGAVVTHDVPDFALVAGVPARQVGWMCRCAVERLDFNGARRARCGSCGTEYRLAGEQVLVENAAAGCGVAPPANNTSAVCTTAKHESPPATVVPLLDLRAQYAAVQDDIMAAVQGVLEHQHFILGPEVRQLEENIAAYCGSRHAVGVSSGTDALLMCLMAEGIGPDDEVITTPYTFFATAGAVARVGARPVFVDIRPDTFNIDPALIEERITSRTRAIIPVHLFGQCADMEPILEIARRRGLIVIEDAAQALGAEYKGRRAGSLGHYGCFSFFPSKNLGGAGDGGMIVSDDAERTEKLRVLRVHGSKPKYHHQVVGGNFRLDTLQAAIINAKLRHLDLWTALRQDHARQYRELLAEQGGVDAAEIRLPHELADCRHVYNQFVIRAHRRDELQAHLRANGIATEVYYPVPAHVQPCFGQLGYQAGSLPESERAAGESLALPIYPELDESRLRYVATQIADCLAAMASGGR